MGKRIALKDSVEVDSVDLSNLARSVRLSSEHAREEVSGFSATGTNEYEAGQTEQEVTVEFYGSYGANEVHQTLYPIHRDREIVPFAWRPDQTKPTATDNPSLEGMVQALSYNPGATRGEADTFEVTFTAADANGLVFTTTP